MLCIDAASDQPLWASFVVLACTFRCYYCARMRSTTVAFATKFVVPVFGSLIWTIVHEMFPSCDYRHLLLQMTLYRPLPKTTKSRLKKKLTPRKDKEEKREKLERRGTQRGEVSVLAPATVTDDTTTATNTCYAAVLTTFPSASPTIAATVVILNSQAKSGIRSQHHNP
ncbi:hypothetical protein BDB00DRAFT_940109 [Zychaea mexicana]|uniref:uncharacterized protein n=1 Tax=Zychaea mexicana TaxID=64656 RepID=UPI0022FE64D5|nr:uncharacterized protein BDB00DRAFT_940109 [Zychaea mexicana]KAI9491825.1 hypothetical protein BDB00DRAFT_940109 [Zychaea mexicana]